jgi:hypothetical protein
MRKLAGIAGMLLAAGCGQDTPPPAKPAGPSATGMVPAAQVQKQADGLFYRAGKVHLFTGLHAVQRKYQHGRSPVGAVVTVRARKNIWRHWVVTGDSWRAQHPFTAHFGLGNVTAVGLLEVRWPDGRVTRLAKPLAGKYHILSAAQAKLEKASKGQ